MVIVASLREAENFRIEVTSSLEVLNRKGGCNPAKTNAVIRGCRRGRGRDQLQRYLRGKPHHGRGTPNLNRTRTAPGAPYRFGSLLNSPSSTLLRSLNPSTVVFSR